MIRAEWEYLKKHKFMTIVLIAIIFIPSIYSVTFLKSMWDPYGELENIPVAVVNEDKATTYQGKQLNAGKDLASNLKKSSAMDFKVMDKKQAREGLNYGKYYMTITIPSDFSKNATTLLNKKPEKMVLHYKTSAGHNYVASKMTSSAAKQAAQSVSDEVTNTYAKTMFSSIKQLSNGMKKASNGSKKLGDGTTQLVSANQQMTTGLDQLASSSLTFADGANTLNNGLSTYINGVSSAASGSQTLATGLNQLNGSTASLSSGVGQLASGSSTLASGVQSYTNGVSQVNSGASQLSSGSDQLANGAGTLATNADTLNSGLSQIYSASNELTQQLQQIGNGNTSSSQLNQVSGSIDNMQSQLSGSNSSQISALQNDLASLQQEIDNVSSGSTDGIKQRLASTADAQGLSADQKAAMLAAVNGSDTGTDTSALKSSANALSADLSKLASAQNTASSTSNTAASDMTTVIQQLAAASEQLTGQIQTASAGMGQLSSGINSLQSSSSQLASGAEQVSAGTLQLMNNNASLNNGASSLNSGLTSLNSQVPTLTSGISQLSSGADQLNSGLAQLNANGSTITSGAGQLSSGATQISSGASQLQSGSTQMGDGLGQLSDGTTDLTTQLANGAKKSKVDPTKLTYAQVAKPTTTKHTERDDAPNNGTGMAPYMISVSLFVGALAFNLMFDLYTPRKYPHSSIGWWASKASLKTGFALLESITVFILLILIDGLAPIHPFATLCVIFLTGLTFMEIVSWLNLVAGKVGAFLSMILLVLQLGGSAGTYPIQLSDGFFNAINPFLPMTYSVQGLRDTLMTGNTAWPEMLILLAIGLVFMFLTMLFYMRRKSRIKEMDFSENSSEKSLV
ncbi:YhgE/Pip domain-containing protein [Companilactobacillus furfuricola]|uniref:YhgE/Pip domain-containing protein n=1 Tax=Companilactobacillus furfuricola TaxID=1462575 RepID=UPI000F7791CE|nr:YhgE/Pip domain-containing protein [Companilactobacillus furfuricola]